MEKDTETYIKTHIKIHDILKLYTDIPTDYLEYPRIRDLIDLFQYDNYGESNDNCSVHPYKDNCNKNIWIIEFGHKVLKLATDFPQIFSNCRVNGTLIKRVPSDNNIYDINIPLLINTLFGDSIEEIEL